MGLPYRADFHPALANLCKRLRYFLGGHRPSQTTRQILSFRRIHGKKLDIQTFKGGISLATPRSLTRTLQSLPPMLNIKTYISIPSYSKASRGLFV